MTIPLIILAIGGLSVGYLFKELLIGNNNFWGRFYFIFKLFKIRKYSFWIITNYSNFGNNAIPISYFFYSKDKTFLEGILKINLL